MKYMNLFTSVIFLSVFTASSSIRIELPCSGVTVFNDAGIARFAAHQLWAEPAQPALPVYRASILLPPDADLGSVTYSIEGALEERIPGNLAVEPAPLHATTLGQLFPRNRTIVDGRDVQAYAENTLLPKQTVTVLDIGLKNCFKIVDLQVSLCRYNPAAQALYQLKSGTLVVRCGTDPQYRQSRSKQLLIPLQIQSEVAKKVVNFASFTEAYRADFTFTAKKKMVILTTSAVQSGSKMLQAFMDSKKARGMDVSLVTESQWGGGTGSAAATNLRTWLQNNYQTLGIYYALFIGNSTGDVSMMTFPDYNIFVANLFCPSDWPYAQLSGDFISDMKCEISVGRFPVYDNNFNTLDSILAKTIAYENTPKDSIAWRLNALMGAGGFASNSKGDKPFEAAHTKIIVPSAPWRDYRIYGTGYGQPTGTPDKVGISETIFSDQWSKGSYGLVSWLTHGSSTSASSVMGSSSTKKVTNKYPAYVFCGACSNGEPSNSGNLGFSALRDCAIGVFAGTNLTDYNPKEPFETSGSNEGWSYSFQKCMVTDSMEIGECLTYLRELDASMKWLNRAPFALYGDPSIGIYTCKNQTSLTQHAAKGAAGHYFLHANALSGRTKASVLFRFTPVQKENAKLKIYSASGTLLNTISLSHGTSSAHWLPGNNHAAACANGIYIATLIRETKEGEQFVSCAKVVVR